MTVISHSRTQLGSFLVAASLLLANPTFGWAENPDPTAPSPSIAEKLLSANAVAPKLQPAPSEATKEIQPLRLRLKGIVLRDNDHGTALVSLGGSEFYVVTLRRMRLDSASTLLNIGGMRLAVTDFSESCVVMESPDSEQQFIIN